MRRLFALAPLLVLALTSCGGGSSPKQAMTVIGVEMAFQAPDTATAGNYTVTFRNDGTVTHELAFKDSSGKFIARTSTGPKTSTTLDVKLAKGTYDLECREPGHLQAGMHKSLVVS